MIRAPFGRIAISALLASSPGCDDDAIIQPAPDPPVIEREAVTTHEVQTPELTGIDLYNGFMPDPMVVEGTTSGAFDVSQWDETCTGFVDPQVSHPLRTDGAFAELRVLAEGEADITLVIRSQDTYLCSQAPPQTTAEVAGPFATGDSQVWVASAEPDTKTEYFLGFSELRGVTHQELSTTARPPVAAHVPSEP